MIVSYATGLRSTFSKTNRMSSQSYMKGRKEGQEVKFYVRTATDKAGPDHGMNATPSSPVPDPRSITHTTD